MKGSEMAFERYTGVDDSSINVATLLTTGSLCLSRSVTDAFNVDVEKRVGVYLSQDEKRIALSFDDDGVASQKLCEENGLLYQLDLSGPIEALGVPLAEMAGKYRLTRKSTRLVVLEKIG